MKDELEEAKRDMILLETKYKPNGKQEEEISSQDEGKTE